MNRTPVGWIKASFWLAWAGAGGLSAANVEEPLLNRPEIGFHQLHVLSPNLLELSWINTKGPDPAPVESWDLVSADGQFLAPQPQEFVVTLSLGATRQIAVESAGFKRRVLYAPLKTRDLRIANYLYLSLAGDVKPMNHLQVVEVKNPDNRLWPANRQFIATANSLRYSPAIHVNQEGYLPAATKKAIVGYYLGSLGEMDLPAAPVFKLLEANTGVEVFQGALVPRTDAGYTYLPMPYQKVWEADFSLCKLSGEYRLAVGGLGASLPFVIHDGIALSLVRAYALGLYHQRCGAAIGLPYTRFSHEVCHRSWAEIPLPQTSFPFAWQAIAQDSSDYAAFARHIAPQLKDESSQLYPFVTKGRVDVSGGHHDAGDYSKYTINSAALIHYLVFAADAFPGAAALDNLGIPESGDGKSDLLQEAKWEADFLAKLQDGDGGFYFLVYPRNRRYEQDVPPDRGDPQVVWPKTTSATAVAVAALAQAGSSPQFKQQFPIEAAAYRDKARRGWDFLIEAIGRHGRDGAYQKLTHYGNEFLHDDELAWAACELFLATGDPIYHQRLREWLPDPADPRTWRWTWWRMWEGYGGAIRSYAFAAKTGRLPLEQLDPVYLARCEAQLIGAAQDQWLRARDNAYKTSFPVETKRFRAGGWYFSADQAFDLAAGFQLDPRPEFVEAVVDNLNYEIGGNPNNVSFVTGLGWKRQREIVHQFAQNDLRVLPPSGLPLGNIQAGFHHLAAYSFDLGRLSFPGDEAPTAPYPYYDRWADAFNVATEFTIVNQARGLATAAFLAARSPLKDQPWRPPPATILGLPSGEVPVQIPVTLTVDVPGGDLTAWRTIWEARDQEPAFGTSYTVIPKNHGSQWVEVESYSPDGTRVFRAGSFFATNGLATVTIAASDPSATVGTGDMASFVFSRTGETQSGLRVKFQLGGTAIKWTDYRRPEGDMPESITIPAGAASVTMNILAVANSTQADPHQMTVTLLADPVYNVGSPDRAGATFAANQAGPTPADPPPVNPPPADPLVTVVASDASGSETGPNPIVFNFSRTGDTSQALTIAWTFSGTAVNGSDYQALPASGTLQPGWSAGTLTVTPIDDTAVEGQETLIVTVAPGAGYAVGEPGAATATIADNDF